MKALCLGARLISQKSSSTFRSSAFKCRIRNLAPILILEASMADLRKTDAEWKAILTPEQYHIARENGTEAPHSGVHNLRMDDGFYTCVCCKTKLFESESKFVPRCGWPSFSYSVPDTIVYKDDYSIPNRPRTEVRCKACDAHLGHVFDDGPQPTGKRYCINSVSIDFHKKK